MLNDSRSKLKSIFIVAALAMGVSACMLLAGCSSPKPAEQSQTQAPGPRRFALKGKVISIDKSANKVTVDHGDIPGFMGAMTMAYPVKNAQLLDAIKPQDQITADVLASDSDVWLENIAVVKDAEATKPPSSNAPPASTPKTDKK